MKIQKHKVKSQDLFASFPIKAFYPCSLDDPGQLQIFSLHASHCKNKPFNHSHLYFFFLFPLPQKAAQKPANLKFVIDCTKPVADQIFDAAAFVRKLLL